jgi:hypothetical protein
MKRLVGVISLLGIIFVLSRVQAQDGTSLLVNGDFADGLANWTLEQPCADCWMEVGPGETPGENALAWGRDNSAGSGSAIFAHQSLAVDISATPSLWLACDIRVDTHSLTNSGWWSDQNNGSGEYPVKIILTFADAQGNPIEWSLGFLSQHDGTTALSNYQQVPAAQWVPIELNVFDPARWVDGRGLPLPAPAQLTGIALGGNGWDFGGAIRHLNLVAVTDGGDGFIVEEYPLVSSSEDVPSHFEFRDWVTPEILAQRQPWREPDPAARIAATNAVIGMFGYTLEGQAGASEYTISHDSTALLTDITHVWPLAVSHSGMDFRLLIESVAEGTLIVTPETIGQIDVNRFIYIAPVFVGDDLFEVELGETINDFVVRRNGEIVYRFVALEAWAEPPIKTLGAWGDHWVLEVDGDLIVDGQSLTEHLGYDGIFGWQLIAGEPFFFFRQGQRIGMSYAGQIQPYIYDQVQHYMCCESSMFNIQGNPVMVWFYARRDGMWYYVEAGVYE